MTEWRKGRGKVNKCSTAAQPDNDIHCVFDVGHLNDIINHNVLQ